MKREIMRHVAFYGVAIMSFCIFSADAMAQMNESPWGFKNQNRASIASLIKQVEDADGNTATNTATTSGAVTQLICGGDSSNASAAGNTTCIILNNSDGIITLDQENNGDQNSDSETTETTNVDETIYVDEVLSTLNGDSQNDNTETLSSLIE